MPLSRIFFLIGFVFAAYAAYIAIQWITLESKSFRTPGTVLEAKTPGVYLIRITPVADGKPIDLTINDASTLAVGDKVEVLYHIHNETGVLSVDGYKKRLIIGLVFAGIAAGIGYWSRNPH